MVTASNTRIRRVSTAGVLAGVIVTAMLALFGGAASAAPAKAQAEAALTAPITGAFTDATGGAGTVTGNFTPTRFFAEGEQLFAEGVADVTLVDSAGQQVGTAAPTVTMPVSAPEGEAGPTAQATCQILDLVLGPLDLDLLGLVVHLDTVHLNITAESGPGNLVGNLLCAIAGLLDGPSIPLASLVDLLNAILAIISA